LVDDAAAADDDDDAVAAVLLHLNRSAGPSGKCYCCTLFSGCWCCT
jgi:hypothetical protein